MLRILLIVLVVYSWSFGANIGFKGIYIGGDAIKGCATLKTFTKTLPDNKYTENKKEGICELSRGSKIKFKGNKIIAMEFSSLFQNKIFNLSGLNLQERAQSLVNNLSWLSDLNYEEKYNGFLEQNIPIYSIRDLNQGYAFSIYSINMMGISYYISLNKIEVKKASF